MTEPSLREILESRVEQVAVAPDALGEIRRRVARQASRRRRTTYGLTALATAATAGVVAVVLSLSTVGPPELGPPAGGPSSAGVTSSGTSPSTPPAAGIPVSVPVYFVATVSGRPVLYREFRTATLDRDDVESRVRAAVALSVAGAALDPDYGTGWPAGTTIAAVRVADGRVDIDLTGGSASTVDASARQQLVWTATAVTANAGQPTTTVRLTVDGTSLPDLVRAPLIDTVAPVWVISPQQGATVAGSFEVHLAGVVFEAAARIRIRDAAGTVLSDDPVLLDAGAPAQGEARVTVTLPPGRYTVEAYFVSEQDGGERGLDGHDVTVA